MPEAALAPPKKEVAPPANAPIEVLTVPTLPVFCWLVELLPLPKSRVAFCNDVCAKAVAKRSVFPFVLVASATVPPKFWKVLGVITVVAVFELPKVRVPVPVKEEEIEAVLKDGVLTISFGKLQQDTIKKIQVL